MAELIPGAITGSVESPLTSASDVFSSLAAMLDQGLNQFRAGHFDEASACCMRLIAKAQPLLSTPGRLNSDDLKRVNLLRACAVTLDGRSAEERGHLDCARQRWSEAVTLFDQSLPESLSASEEWLGQAFSKDVANKTLPADLLAYYGVALRMSGRRTDAIRVFGELLHMGAALPETYRHLGLALKDEGQLQEAVQQLKKALDLSLSDIPSWRGLAECYEDLSDKTDAANAYLNLAQLLLSGGRSEDALAAAANSVRLNDSNPAALRYYGDVLRVAGRPEEALPVLDRALAISPQDPIAWAVKGAALYKIGRNVEALEAFDRALAVNPNDSWTLLMKGELLTTTGRSAEAEAVLRHAIGSNPKAAPPHTMLAYALCDLNRPAEALPEADAACAIDPADALAYGARGATLYRLGRFDEAYQTYSHAAELGAGMAFAWIGKAESLHALRRFDEALAAVNRAIELDAKSAWAHILKGRVLYSLDEKAHKEEVLGCMRNAIHLNPSPAEASELAASFLALGAPADAVTAADRALESAKAPRDAVVLKAEALLLLNRPSETLELLPDPLPALEPRQSAYALGLRGEALALLGRSDEAVSALRQSVDLDATFDWTWRALASLLAASDPQGCLEAVEHSLALNSNQSEALTLKADALTALGRRSDALDALEKAAALEIESPSLQLKLADLYVDLGQNEQALEAVRKTLALQPDSGLAHGLLGYILHSLRDPRQAEAALEKAIDLGAELVWVYSELGSVRRELDKPDGALDAIAKALKLEPGFPPALETQGQVYIAIGEFQAAVNVFEGAIGRGAKSYFWKGLALDTLERIGEARDCYEKALEIDPEDVWSLRALADAYLICGRADEAKLMFERILVKMASAARGPYEIGLCAWCHYGCGRLDPAIRLYSQALSLDREGTLKSAPFDLALISAAAQRYAAASREYDRAIDVTLQAHRWLQKGLYAVAISDLQRAMKVRYPAIASSPEVQGCLERLKEAYNEACAYPDRPRIDLAAAGG